MQHLLEFGEAEDHDRRVEIASALLAVVFILFVLIRGVLNLKDAYEDPAIHVTDFRFLYNAGVVATSRDARLLYGPEPDANTWVTEKGYNYPVWYPYPPAVAVATGALQPLGRDGAATAWRVLVALCTIALAEN